MMKPCGLVLITNVISEGSGEPVLVCNLGGSRCPPTQSFEVDKDYLYHPYQLLHEISRDVQVLH